jgi:hypothetical protein
MEAQFCSKRLATILTLTVAASASASAGTVLIWTLQNVTFEDGTAATGSFGYDADTLTVSDVDITTAGGASYFAVFFTSGLAISDSWVDFYQSPIDLSLNSAAPLTSSGGTIPLIPYAPGNPLSGYLYHTNTATYSDLTGGEITASGGASAPEPGTFLLMASAGGLALWMGRRRKGRKASEGR